MALSLFSSTSKKRAFTQVNLLEQELSALFSDPEDLPKNKRGYLQEVKIKVQEAHKALENDQTELAWQLYNSAKRSQLNLESPSALAFKQRALWHEADEKLKGWREEAVHDVITKEKTPPGTDGEEPEPIDIDVLIEAYEVLHEHFSNVYIKNNNILNQLFTLSVTAFSALVIFLLILQNRAEMLTMALPETASWHISLIISVLLLGVMGACVSGIFSLAGGTGDSKIPKQQINVWITISRPIVGAISALVLYIFIISDLFLPNMNLNTAGVLAVSFVAGFTERLIIRAVSSVTNQSKFDPESKSPQS